MDAGGRATQGAVAEGSRRASRGRPFLGPVFLGEHKFDGIKFEQL